MKKNHAQYALAAMASAMFGAALTVPGCEDRNSPNTTSSSAPSPDATRANPGATGNRGTPSSTRPDNTGVNTRDRSPSSTTPPDQGENETDRRITADIRKAILAQDGMSVNAQNCKIITRNGVVTLRGPVNSDTEREAIEGKAKAVAGVTSVINELEVAPK